MLQFGLWSLAREAGCSDKLIFDSDIYKQKKQYKYMKNTTIFFLVVILIALVGGFVFVKGKNNSVTGNVIAENPTVLQGPIQQVTLSMKDYNYFPQEVKVKANQPVEITIDDSVRGCLRSFAVRDLGVSGYAKTPTDKITFTPTIPGTFKFSCAMGMGYGNLIVE